MANSVRGTGGHDGSWNNTTSVQGFDDLVGMLRSSASDAETIAVAESMGKLAKQVEAIVPLLNDIVQAQSIGPHLLDLMSELRHHRQMVINLDQTWRDLPEHANYVVALNNFRLLLNQWLMERSVNKLNPVELTDFEALAWRTLGDGMLLMDMHRQLSKRAFSETSQAELEPERAERASNWWKKLRGDGA